MRAIAQISLELQLHAVGAGFAEHPVGVRVRIQLNPRRLRQRLARGVQHLRGAEVTALQIHAQVARAVEGGDRHGDAEVNLVKHHRFLRVPTGPDHILFLCLRYHVHFGAGLGAEERIVAVIGDGKFRLIVDLDRHILRHAPEPGDAGVVVDLHAPLAGAQRGTDVDVARVKYDPVGRLLLVGVDDLVQPAVVVARRRFGFGMRCHGERGRQEQPERGGGDCGRGAGELWDEEAHGGVLSGRGLRVVRLVCGLVCCGLWLWFRERMRAAILEGHPGIRASSSR